MLQWRHSTDGSCWVAPLSSSAAAGSHQPLASLLALCTSASSRRWLHYAGLRLLVIAYLYEDMGLCQMGWMVQVNESQSGGGKKKSRKWSSGRKTRISLFVFLCWLCCMLLSSFKLLALFIRSDWISYKTNISTWCHDDTLKILQHEVLYGAQEQIIGNANDNPHRFSTSSRQAPPLQYQSVISVGPRPVV